MPATRSAPPCGSPWPASAANASSRRRSGSASTSSSRTTSHERPPRCREPAMLTLGIDLGTSAVKAALLDDDDRIVATASRPLDASHPRPGFTEQDPEDWWQATSAAIDAVRAGHAAALSE